LRQKLNSNQWRNTQQVISWFGNINDKNRHSFISFDIVDFYPSISEKLLNEALAWASDFIKTGTVLFHLILWIFTHPFPKNF
jgi:hypothetical protein